MSSGPSLSSGSVLWSGKPWIFPNVLARSIVAVAIGILVFWFELRFGFAYVSILNVQAIFWTGLVLFLAWILSLGHLLVLRASHVYVLRNDSLEIRTGILRLRSYVIVPFGFSDLEVTQSVFERIINSGKIVIHSESERDVDRKMVKVRNPMKVAEQIRYVMAREIVRMEKP